jgi:hypothetical protein
MWMLLPAASAHFILRYGQGWKFDKWNDFASAEHEGRFQLRIGNPAQGSTQTGS